MIDEQWIPILSPTFRLQWEEAQDSYVLLYPEGMVKLNGPAGEILSRCDGEKSVSGIIAELKSQFPDAQSIPEDVKSFLEAAGENGWIAK